MVTNQPQQHRFEIRLLRTRSEEILPHIKRNFPSLREVKQDQEVGVSYEVNVWGTLTRYQRALVEQSAMPDLSGRIGKFIKQPAPKQEEISVWTSTLFSWVDSFDLFPETQFRIEWFPAVVQRSTAPDLRWREGTVGLPMRERWVATWLLVVRPDMDDAYYEYHHFNATSSGIYALASNKFGHLPEEVVGIIEPRVPLVFDQPFPERVIW